MSFDSLPVSINAKTYKRFAFFTPSDAVPISPVPDAIMIVGGGIVSFAGTDQVEVGFTIPATGVNPQIFPISITYLLTNNQATVMGLWYD